MINSDKELFNNEQTFLNFIGKTKITDSSIDVMSKQWIINYAKD